MRYAAVLGTVALTELMAHFLSLGWGIMTLLAAFAWVALSGASVAAKARSTEDRLSALVPVIGDAHTLASNAFPKTGGTVSGSVTVTGNHAVNGQVNAGTLSTSGNATTGGDHTVHGSLNADSNVSASGTVNGGAGSFGSVASTTYSGSSIHVSGNAQSDGTFTAGGDVNAGGTVRGALHASNAVIDTMSAVASPAATLTSLKQAVDGILNRL